MKFFLLGISMKEEKKGKGMASLKRKIPADISSDMEEEIKQYAVNTFHALQCEGYVA